MKKLRDYIYHEEEAGVIYCGDCLKIMPMLDPNSFDLIVTDPPYDLKIHRGSGIGGRDNVKVYRSINKNFGNGFDLGQILEIMKKAMKIINAYYWCSERQVWKYLQFCEENSLKYNIMAWHKNNPIPFTNGTYLPDTEYCIFMRSKKAPFTLKLDKSFYKTLL